MPEIPARPKLSVVIITKNEEEMLPGCLARLTWADEILVVDSFSTDRTVEIAHSAGARVLQHPFTDFASQFNYGIDNAGGDWLLLVDADELADAGLAAAVRAVLAAAEPEHTVYLIRRDSVVFAQRMHSKAWSDEWIPRLFRKGELRFVGAVHPVPMIGENVLQGRLRGGKLLHYTYRSTEKYFEKFQLYSTLWARKAQANGRRSGLFLACAAGTWRVFHNYFIRLEFLDGRMGILLSLLAGMHTFIRHVKLWGLENEGDLARVDEDAAAAGETVPPSPPPPPKEKKEPSA